MTKSLFYNNQKIYKHLNQYLDGNKLDLIQASRKNPLMYKVIERIYKGHNLLKNGEHTFPVAIIDLPDQQIHNPDSILGRIDKNDIIKIPPHFKELGENHVELMRKMGRTVKNLPTFCIKELRYEKNGDMKIDCCMGKYFDALRTSDVLEWELLTAIEQAGENVNIDSVMEHNLYFRNYVHSISTGDPVINPGGCSPYIGISTLVLFNCGDHYAVIIAKRSREHVAVENGLYHVVPSFVFQPVAGEADKEFNLTHNIYREYLEEIFGFREIDGKEGKLPYDYFYSNPEYMFLQDLIKKGDARIQLTGLVVNLLDLRPEICTLLYIESTDWYHAHINGKNNLARIDLNSEWQTGKNKNVIPVNDVGSLGLTPANIAPPGAAALYLGLQRVQLHQTLP